MLLKDSLPCLTGRSPHGERGLKLDVRNVTRDDGFRSPHGERGLKFERKFEGCTKKVALLMESVD